MTTAERIFTTTSAQPKRFSVDDFRRMTEAGILPEESGWEIIDGFLIDKMTIGSRHASIVKRLNQMISAFCSGNYVVSVQDPVRIDDYNEPEPDIAVLRFRGDFYASAHPGPADVLMLIEVSDSTAGLDRNVKLDLYARAGISEVWLVDANADAVERYREPENGRFSVSETFARGDLIESVSVKELLLEVDEILGE